MAIWRRARLGSRDPVVPPLPLGSAVNNFFDRGNFETMKTLSGWEAARCDAYPFRAKI